MNDDSQFKVIHVPTHFRTFRSKQEVELFGQKTPVEISSESGSRVDGERLAKDLADTIAKLSAEGYAVTTVTPVLSGKCCRTPSGDDGDDDVRQRECGFSFTDSLVVVANRGDPGMAAI